MRLRAVLSPIVLALLLGATTAFAQGHGAVRGTVKDKETGDPVPYANVLVRGTPLGRIVDSDGAFFFSSLPEGRHEIVVSRIGYQTASEAVTVRSGETTVLDFELVTSPIQMEEVVITGTKTPRHIKDVPVRTQVLTREAIEQTGACDLYQALDGTPGVRVEEQCQACNFSQVRLLGLGPDHTQVLIDGQPVYSGLAAVYGLQQIGTASIERIEVVKGGASALYGGGAIAGAINLISRIPTDRPTAGLTLQFGDHSTQRYELTASQRVGRTGIGVYAQRNKAGIIDETRDGIGRGQVYAPDNVSDRVRSDVTLGGFHLTVDDVRGIDRVTLQGRALRETRQGGELYNSDHEVPEDVYENPFSPGTERIITDRWEGRLALSKLLEGGNTFDVSFAYARHDRNATNDTFVGDYEAANGQLPPLELLRPYLASEDLYVVNFDTSHPLWNDHRLLVGGQFTRNELDETGMYVIVDDADADYGLAYRSATEKRATDLSGYVQDEWSLSRRLELVAGVRYDHHTSRDEFKGLGGGSAEASRVTYQESSLSGRASARLNVTPAVVLRASAGTGFRVPYGFSEDLHLCSGSPRVWKSGQLEPEESMSMTLSADYATEHCALGVTVYRVDLTGKVGLVDAGPAAEARGYSYEWRNLGDAYVQGVEIDARLEPHSALAFEAYATIGSGEFDQPREDWVGTEWEEESTYISRLPKCTTGIRMDFHPHQWRFVVDADLQGPLYIDYYVDGEEPTKIKETESHVVVDARAARKVTDVVEVFAGAKNVTDYVQPEKHVDDAAFMYAPVYGRIVYAGMQLDF